MKEMNMFEDAPAPQEAIAQTLPRNGLYIQHIRMENIKRIRIFEMTPDGEPVILEGRNKQGKSSILNGLAMALGGAKFIGKDPVNHDSEEGGYIEVSLSGESGHIKISRRFSKSGKPYLDITTEDGMSPSKAQTWLDQRLSALSFDPLKFITDYDRDKKAAIQALRIATGLDTTEIDQRIATAEADRRESKHRRDNIKAEIESLGNLPTLATVRSVEQVQSERNKLSQENIQIENAKTRIEALGSGIENASNAIKEYERKIAELRQNIEKAEKERETLTSLASKTPHDLSMLDQEIVQINKQSALKSQYDRKRQLEAQMESAVNAVIKDEATVKQLRESRQKMIADAKMPIEGLEFDSESIRYNGVDLNDASEAEKIDVALGVLTAQNPKIRIALIYDGEKLDKESKKLLLKKCREQGIQPFIQTVADEPSNSKHAVYIEDGTYQA